MSQYANKTKVSPDKSKAEIERTLMRYGATAFAFAWQKGGAASVGFEMNNRRFRLDVEMPQQGDLEFRETATGKPRTEAAAFSAWEQACRQRWRALALVIKAKLEAVESGIVSFEDEFMAHTILPGGKTMKQWAAAELGPALESGRTPKLLPARLS